MVQDRKRFIELREFTIRLQARIRGMLDRQSYLKRLPPEVIQHRLEQRAAKKIQTMWRGYRVRKRLNKKMGDICRNVRKLANPDKASTLGSQLRYSLKFLKGKYLIPECISVLQKLGECLLPQLFFFV